MASLPSPSSPSSPSRVMRRRGCVRRVERYCCNIVTYFPLAFVYGVTSWAVWVEAGMGFDPTAQGWTGKASSFLGILFYILLNWSYTTAVFTDPGSPLSTKNGYSHLPTQESAMAYTSFTVKSSTGDIRFCKKCQSKKPDRAHHCSSCGRCVLKMDHHCPWLATCVGLRNYKAFLLFLTYLSLFCWVCFATSATWVWNQVLSESQYSESFMPVNYVLLAVLSGIIGLVITGFTSWHLWLTSRGRTTIESLEKTRYLSPLRNSMKNQLNDRNYIDARDHGRLSVTDQLREIHANALPGITRPEEGQDSPSRSASHSPDRHHQSTGSGYSPAFPSYGHRERQRDYDRYDSYLDERDNELLPNAFDLGWRRNFGHVFGLSLLLAFVPICNTTGDGWTWEPSPKWLAALERVTKEREAEANLQKQRERAAGWGLDSPTELEFMQSGRGPGAYRPNHSPSTSAPRQTRRPEWQSPGRNAAENRYLTTTNGVVAAPPEGRRSPGKADQILGRERGMYSDGDVQLQSLDRRKLDQYYVSDDDEISSDEETREHRPLQSSRSPTQKPTENWNDVPEDFLQPPPRRQARKSGEQGGGRSRSKENGWDDWGGDN